MCPFILLILLLFGAILLPVAKAGERDDESLLSYRSYAFGKEYTTVIREDAVKKSPVWLATAENPPVSVRKAIKLADAKRQKLVHDTTRFKWRRESISLEFFRGVEVEDRYKFPYWHIHYEAHGGGETGPPDDLDLFVLMDGTLIEPIVSLPGKGPPD